MVNRVILTKLLNVGGLLATSYRPLATSNNTMDTLVIQGGKKLHGEITVGGSKNACLAILAGTTLVAGEIKLSNIPKIGDVLTMLDILKSMGSKIKWTADHEVVIDNIQLDPAKMDFSLVGKIRASLMLMGPLAARFKKIKISTPGGCRIGTRPIDAHLKGLMDLGFDVSTEENFLTISQGGSFPAEIVMSEFSVTATQNVILAAVGLGAEVVIKIAAAEYSVQDLCWFLNKCGAKISGIGTHTLKIEKPKSVLQSTYYEIMNDPIEAGTFLALAGATGSQFTVKNVPIDMMVLELEKFKEAGLVFDISEKRWDADKHYYLADLLVKKTSGIKPLAKLHDMPAPGVIADFLQPFSVMLTQAKGISLIYDWMYDGRLKYVKELKRMGADMKVLDAHRVMIIGPTPLNGKEITSFDLRAGATLLIAALAADGESIIREVEQIDRGYENVDERLRQMGADIERRSI